MSDSAFNALLTQAYGLYRQGEYASALDLITRQADHFPERGQTLYFWRMAGDTPLALRLLAEALEAGHWYPERQLRQDEDLRPLQGLPEFERLAETSRQRYATAQALAKPELLVLPPAPAATGEPLPLLLALHGNMNTAAASADFPGPRGVARAGWRPATQWGWLVALPQSSQVGGPDAYVWDDRDWAGREVQGHYASLAAQYLVDRARGVLAGFSLGGETAIWLALTAAIPARGFIAVAPGGPMTRQPDAWAPLIEASPARGLRGCLVLGEQDVPNCENGLVLAALLHARGIPCEVEVHPDLGHDFPPGFAHSLGRALRAIGEAA